MKKEWKVRNGGQQLSQRVLLLLALAFACAQPATAQIHIKAVQGVGLGGGVSDLGQQASLRYTRFLHRNWHLQAGIGYEQASVASLIAYQAFGAELRAYRTLYDFKETLFLNLGLSVAGSYEQISGLETVTKNKAVGFAYGLGLGATLEHYLSPRFALILEGFQYYRIKGLGTARYQASFGVRYFLH